MIPLRRSTPAPGSRTPVRPRRARAPRSRRVALATLVATGLLAGAPAAQASYVGSGSDAANDVATPSPGHDIVGVAVALDPRTGQMRAQIRLRGEPSSDAPADVNVFAGRRTATGCNGFPAIGFSTLDTARGAVAVRLSAAAAEPTVRSIAKDGAGTPVQDFDVTLPALMTGVTPNCVIARSAKADDTSVVYDTAGPYALRGVPGLIAELGRTPRSMTPGQTRSVRLVLRNPGHAGTGRIRLSVGKARGLRVRHPRTVASIAGGKRKTVTLRVSLSRSAKRTTTLRVKASAPKKLTAKADARLRLASPSAGGGGSGGGDGPKLCYRYTWYPPYGELQIC